MIAARAAKKEYAHHRLSQLYEISKLLSTFQNVETGFPGILSAAAEAYPLSSAVLIERRGETPQTSIWPTSGLNEEQVTRAISNARSSYSALMDSTAAERASLGTSGATEGKIREGEFHKEISREGAHQFIALPILLGNGPVFGLLQLETTGLLTEEDLGFADALANILAVALDRVYRAEDERELQAVKTAMNASQLAASRDQVLNLEEERELRSAFVSALSHDLRTPLTAAKLGAQLVLRNAEDAGACRLLATRVIGDLDRVDQMIGDLLDAQRVRAGERLRLDLDLCDLLGLLQETIRAFSVVHGNRFILDTNLREAPGFWSRTALRRVVENLLGNAIKYGRPGSPILVALGREGQRTQFSVHNEGDPIPTEVQATLFQQFKRAGSAQASTRKGWGLGLVIVKGLVEAHGGTVGIESSAGRGTSFVVELPDDSRPFQAESGTAFKTV